MDVKDIRGIKIDIGSFIRYTGTGTTGKVIDIKVEDDKPWIELEKPNLWYLSETVEVVDAEDTNHINKNKNKKSDELEDIKDLKDDFEDISVISGGGEGGG